MDNQLSYWYPGQIVTATQMTALVEDLYMRLTQLTQTLGNVPDIGLILDLESLSQTGGNVSIGAGSFRFPDSSYTQLPYNTGNYGKAPAATVAVTGNGFIVARFVIDPNTGPGAPTPGQYNYTFPTTYQFVTTVDSVTDCLICSITAGVISGYGRFNILSDINDNPITGEVTIGSGAIQTGKKVISLIKPTVGPDTPQVTLTLLGDNPGGYTALNINNEINGNNYIYQASAFADAGDGNFKPNYFVKNYYNNYSTYFLSRPSGAPNYNGFYTSIQNYTDESLNTESLIEFFADDNNNPETRWGVYENNAVQSGLLIVKDNALNKWYRPQLWTSTPIANLLTDPTSSVAIFNDFDTFQAPGIIRQNFPNNTVIQAGFGIIPNGATSVTLLFNAAFASEVTSIVPGIINPGAPYRISCEYSLTSVVIYIDTPSTGDLSVSYIAIGY